MNRWKLIAGVTAVFVLGALLGVLATGMLIKHFHPLLNPNRAPRKAFIMSHLTKTLDLDADQKAQIDRIVDRHQKAARQQFIAHRREMVRMLDQGYHEIRQELTPAQQKRFDQLKSKFDARRQARAKRLGIASE